MVSNSIFIIMILTFYGSVYSQFYSNGVYLPNSYSQSRIVYGSMGDYSETGFTSIEHNSVTYSNSIVYNGTSGSGSTSIVEDYTYSQTLYSQYTTETVTDVISIVSTSTDAIMYVPTVISNYSEYATINTTTLVESQLSTTSSALSVEFSTYSLIASFFAESVYNTYVCASEGFYIASNSSYSAIFQSPTTTYTSYELFPIFTTYKRSLIDTSIASELFTITRTVFLIAYEGDTPYTTCSLVSVVDSFPQTTDGTYSVNSRHLSTTLVTTSTEAFDGYYLGQFSANMYALSYATSSTYSNNGESVSKGGSYIPSETITALLGNILLSSQVGISVSSYVGSGIDIPSAGWSYSDRTSIPAWFSGGAEISLDGNLFDYISTSIIVPSIGTRYAEKEDSSFTVSIDSLFRCSSTWRYPVGTSTQTSSATMQLEAQGTNPLFINTANDILGGYPEINHSYTFVRGPGAFAVTNGDAYGFTTTTQSFTNTGATSFSSTMNNTITEITQYPLILGLSALPIMTYDF